MFFRIGVLDEEQQVFIKRLPGLNKLIGMMVNLKEYGWERAVIV